MFKTRLHILSALFGLSFLVILGRLWQLQVIRHEKYEALTTRDRSLDAIARKWASPRTPQRIVGGIDEKTWLALRASHEDIFRDSRLVFGAQAETLAGAQAPPFPGLVCTVSTRRFYPLGRRACFILG